VKFFKKIRKLLKVSDEAILLMFPDKEDFLLPDIEKDDYVFHSEKSFNPVKLIFEK
jgi:hypothetical protein